MMFSVSMPFKVFQVFNIEHVYYISKENRFCIKKMKKGFSCFESKMKAHITSFSDLITPRKIISEKIVKNK